MLSRKGFGDFFAREKSHKVSLLKADYFQRWHDSIIFLEFVNSTLGQRDADSEINLSEHINMTNQINF
jgi:hypothetical protein